MGAADVIGCVLEGGEVERKWAVPDVGSEHGGTDAVDCGRNGWGIEDAGKDAVLVGFTEGAVAGVEALGRDFDGEDANTGREGSIERAMEVCGRDRNGESEGGYLGQSMDAGVGTAGSLGEDGLSCDAFDCLGQGALDGGLVGLDLPAVVAGSIVGESGFPERHGDIRTVSRCALRCEMGRVSAGFMDKGGQ